MVIRGLRHAPGSGYLRTERRVWDHSRRELIIVSVAGSQRTA
jgi:hypothetical protein